MKKLYILFTLLLAALSVQAQIASPSLWIDSKDGSTNYYYSDIQKITFSDGNMVVSMKEGGSNSFAISSIIRLLFMPGGGFVQQETVKDFFVWAPLTKELSVRCPAGTAIRVYSPNGRLALTAIQSITQSPVNLSSLPKGVYVVEAASKTSKIVLR